MRLVLWLWRLLTYSADESTAHHLAIPGKGLLIDGKEIPFPGKKIHFAGVLGEPNHTANLENRIYVWGTKGFCVYSHPQRDFIDSIAFEFQLQGYPFSPKLPFRGSITIGSAILTSETRADDLVQMGFTEDADGLPVYYKTVGRNSMMIVCEDERLSQVSVRGRVT